MANITPIPLPKGYQRLDNFPLDSTTLFSNLTSLTSYAINSPVAYAGQVCVDSSSGRAYVINSDGSLTNLADADGGTF